ncbi:kunitz-type elastase inhibitor BrEI-like [Lotus japonicus]|uniref:kunitz-type elastase inhibitor BrEI-like n=1 Tax=Lotus japonicus TaxID=34305 RepID=UPI002588AC3F|nr:kunitz-type elastase inhibitor BrEI-like [Lotus japonicus]
MKLGTMFQILPLCFLSLLVLNTQPLLADEPEPAVVDMQGNPLLPGVQYYVRPVSAEKGGLALGHTRKKTCPLDIILDPSSIIGSPTVFHTSSSSDVGYIPISTDLTVEMPILGSPCKEPKVWRLAKVGSDFWFVSTQGVPGNLVSKFKIVRFEERDNHANEGEIYSFSFCPSVYGVICAPVGIYVDDDGTQVMAVGAGVGKPYHVRFQKVSSAYLELKNQDFSGV